jgi:hypothetical protein
MLCLVIVSVSFAQPKQQPKPQNKPAEKQEIKITESDDPEFNQALEDFKEAARDEYLKEDDKIVENEKAAKNKENEKQHLAQNNWGSLTWAGPAVILTLGIGFVLFMNNKKRSASSGKKKIISKAKAQSHR